MSGQSTPAVGKAPFEPEDYAHVAKLLRLYRSDFPAACSNNLNIILAALDASSSDLAPAERIDMSSGTLGVGGAAS